MARYAGPKCRLCRREGTKLYLKGERCEGPQCPITRQHPFPGQHGAKRAKRRTRLSDYARQLREKQKVKRIYGILERQFRVYVGKAKAARGEAGIVLLQKLELRLDNVVYRLGLAKSRAHARQLIRQGKIAVNRQKVDAPSFEVPVSGKIAFAKGTLEIKKNLLIPKWLSWDAKASAGIVRGVPEREHIGQDIDEALIIEYYSR